MKKAIITGASSGLGKEIATRLLEKGVHVINLSRTESSLDVVTIPTDLTKHEDIVNALQIIKNDHQDVDLLILNAGVLHRHVVGETPLTEVDSDFAVNVMGAIKLTDGLVSFITKNRGDIVFVGSTSSFVTHAETSVYNAAKHAVLGYVKSLQTELKKENVRVIGFYPGGFQSQLHINAGSNLSEKELMNPNDLSKLLMSTLEMPRGMQVSQVIIDRKKAGMS
ncbi:TPA: SDR family NAD(P)-dependent oxidoreductase [Candidatus Woesearchaeota archaeon]|mgnify:CR=1 FL=1|nr:SDR family NAD(P)-dependent oxidoreductase [Candidatus Woesearchaeota archaeon]